MRTLKLLFLSFILLMPHIALAQAYDSGGAVPVTYHLGTGPSGTAPASAYEPAFVPNPGIDIEDFLTTTGADREEGPGVEKKARFICGPGPLTRADMILAAGVEVGPHLHHKVGNVAWNQNSTYASLRTTTTPGTCSGINLNNSAYWMPAMMFRVNSGLLVAINQNYTNLYYNCGDQTCTDLFPRGFRLITGFNPADPNNQVQRDEIAAYNTTYGDNYQFREDIGGGFLGITCQAAGNPSIQGTPNGEWADDPDGNGKQNSLSKDGIHPTLICPANGEIIFDLVTQPCWDRTNLTSPNGRGHVRHLVRNNSGNSNVCPDGYGRVAQIEWKVSYPVGPNPADIAKWYLSSDRMDPDPENWFKNGQTFHADAVLAWEESILNQVQANCNGIAAPGLPADGADCDNATINDTQAMLNPTNTNIKTGAARYLQIPAALATGAYSMQAKYGLMMHEHAEDRSQVKWYQKLSYAEMATIGWATAAALFALALILRLVREFRRRRHEP